MKVKSNTIERIEDKRIRRWYEKYLDLSILDDIVTQAEQDGYVLDPKSGLLIREVTSFDDIMKDFGYQELNFLHPWLTIKDIIFLHPVDLHYHENEDEAILVMQGKGKFCMRSKGGFPVEEDLYKGKEIYIFKGWSHTFRPNKNEFLEIRMAHSGYPNKEVCVQRFDEFEPWIWYYTQTPPLQYFSQEP